MQLLNNKQTNAATYMKPPAYASDRPRVPPPHPPDVSPIHCFGRKGRYLRIILCISLICCLKTSIISGSVKLSVVAFLPLKEYECQVVAEVEFPHVGRKLPEGENILEKSEFIFMKVSRKGNILLAQRKLLKFINVNVL